MPDPLPDPKSEEAEEAKGEGSPSKAKPLNGAFMPASLRLKRGIQKPKAKVRRTNSDLETKDDVEMVPAHVFTMQRPTRRSVAHDIPARECRSADEYYDNLRPVQEGRHGVVYKAVCKETGAVVALKNMKNCKDGNPGGFSMVLLREVNILLTVSHPNIITLREVVHVSQEDDGDGEEASWFLVLEFVEHDLKDVILTMSTPFSEAQVKHLMFQMIDAVHALHEAWVLHRDLKTANLLLDAHGTLKVCDLGMARHFGHPYKRFTEEVISRWYRPPEIILGIPQYTENVDVWSLGCIFGELLQRAVLLPGSSEIDQLNQSWALVGTPTKETWPLFPELTTAKGFTFKPEKTTLRTRFPKIGFDPDYVHGEACKTTSLSDAGMQLLSSMLAANPEKRSSAHQCLENVYFSEIPYPEPLSSELLAELQREKPAALARAKEEAKREAEAKAQQARAAQLGINPFGGTISGGKGLNQSQLLQQMLANQRMQQMQAMGGAMNGRNFPGKNNPLMAGGMPGTCPRCRMVHAICQCNQK